MKISAMSNTAIPSIGTKFNKDNLAIVRTGGVTSITNFTGGSEGARLTILFEHATTITYASTKIILNGAVDFVGGVGDTLSLIKKADGYWYETSRSQKAAAVVGAALSAYNTGAFGLSAGADVSALLAAVVAIRAELIARGIMKAS